jgi:hypothetical protein
MEVVCRRYMGKFSLGTAGSTAFSSLRPCRGPLIVAIPANEMISRPFSSVRPCVLQVATLGAGLYTAMQTFEGLPGSGEHVLTPLQRLLRRAADDATLFGSAAAAVPAVERQAAAVESASRPPAEGSNPELR